MPKNAVIVTLDSVRADHTSLNGYERETTPSMKQLFDVNFTNARANAPCTPHSMPSMLVGDLPISDGLLALNKRKTLPSYLHQAGYQSCLINSNIQIQRFGYHADFDEYMDFTSNNQSNNQSYRFKNTILEKGEILLNSGGTSGKFGVVMKDIYHRFNGIIQPHEKDLTLIKAAIDWMSQVSEPFFLWIHLMDTHYPYEFDEKHFNDISDFTYDENRYARLLTRAMTHTRRGDFVWNLNEDQRQFIKDAYDASIRQADENISQLVSSINLDNTIFVCTADHGEELWDHGHFGHAGRSSIPRQMTLYEEMLHVPLMLAGCEAPIPSEEVNRPVTLIDLVPTILEETGFNSEKFELSGQNILGELTAKDRKVVAQTTSPGDPVDYNNSSTSKWLAALIEEDTKTVVDSHNNCEIFRLPREEKVNKDSPSLTKIKETNASYLRNMTQVAQSQEKIEMNDDLQDQLKELGYLG